MTRLEYVKNHMKCLFSNYAIPEMCQVFQNESDSDYGVICYNIFKKEKVENYLKLELCDKNTFLVSMKINTCVHNFLFDNAIEACIKYNELTVLHSGSLHHCVCKQDFFRAIRTKPCRIYLDDIRNPQTEGFVVLRSYQEFVDYVLMFGCPSYISFDHDLGNNIPSGYDCLKWLIDHDLQSQGFIPDDFEINVHSANPVGKENIEKLWNSYKTFKTNL